MSAVLVFAGVAMRYQGRQVLSGLEFSLEAGEVLAVAGPSGIGKSTLLRLAGGLARPSGGEVLVAARRMGFVFQDPRLLPWRTALENVVLPLLARGVGASQARSRAAGLLARMGLEAFTHAYPAALSGGMRQRVSLARAFAVGPDLLLLDEPFTGLDPELRLSMRRHLDELLDESGAAALHVTHDIDDVPSATERILRLSSAGASFERPPARPSPQTSAPQPETAPDANAPRRAKCEE